MVGEGVIHSTDTLIESEGNYREFFAQMNASGDFKNLSRMHSKNLVNAKKSMDEGVSPVVVDNTNLRANEAKAYVEHALKIGFADENIRIVDVGTGGQSVEVLAERNQHGVPLEKIKSMVQTHASVGELTLKKILESKDMYANSDILFSAVLLDEYSKVRLKNRFLNEIPLGWTYIGSHMTIEFGKPVPNSNDLGREVTLTAIEVGLSDMAMAVKVEGYPSKRPIPHITLAINPSGGKPVMSNDITEWQIMKPFDVKGIVSNVKKRD